MLLVTGGTGFIGSHLVQELCARRQPVRCLIRRETRLPDGAEAAPGDLVSGQGLADALRGVDTVIHLAGITKALSSSDYYSGNVHATGNLAQAIRASSASIKLIHVSSLAAVGPSLDSVPVSEDAPPHPVSEYGKSKLEGEKVVRSLLADAVIVRPAVVYGPGDKDVFQLFKSISQGLAIEIAGPERFAQAIYVKDLVEGLLAAACAPAASGRAYFLAHPEPLSWTQLRTIAAEIMHKRPRVLKIPAPLAYAVAACAEVSSRVTRRPGIVSRDKIHEAMCRYWTCDTRRAARELGFEAHSSLGAGIAATLAWYKEAGWLKY